MKTKKLLFLLLVSLVFAYIIYSKYDIGYNFTGKYEVSSSVINNIISNNINENMNEYDKVKAIHDYIITTTEYDHINLQKNTIPDIDYTAKGVLEKNIGVCRGYAEAFMLLMKEIGIECDIVTGHVENTSHAWNVVKIDGEWYQIDCTYDDPVDTSDNGQLNSNLRYDYFLVTNSQMYLDHTPDEIKYSCTSEKYMYMDKQKDVPYYVLDSVQKLPTSLSYTYNMGYTKVTFYFPENIDLSDEQMLNKISQALGYNSNVTQFSYTPIAKCGKYYYTTITVS